MNPPEQQDELTRLADGVADLTDLFRRRLLNDRTAAERDSTVTGLLEGRFLDAFLHRLRMVLDRLETEARYAEEADRTFARSVAEELEDALTELHVETIAATGPFDSTLHVAVGRESAQPGITGPTVVDVRAVGFRHRGRVIIPADVIVAVPDRPREER